MFESFNDEDSLMNNIRDVLLELDDINFRTSVTKKSDSLERITINIDKSTNQVGIVRLKIYTLYYLTEVVDF
jgi:hypothetical protein